MQIFLVPYRLLSVVMMLSTSYDYAEVWSTANILLMMQGIPRHYYHCLMCLRVLHQILLVNFVSNLHSVMHYL